MGMEGVGLALRKPGSCAGGNEVHGDGRSFDCVPLRGTSLRMTGIFK